MAQTMAIVNREMLKLMHDWFGVFSVVALTGPRQAGKSTLLRNDGTSRSCWSLNLDEWTSS